MAARRRTALALLAVVLLAGCAPAQHEPEPSAVTVDVTQGRTDRDGRIIVMDVTNTSTTPVTLLSARLDTPQFAEPAQWSRGTTLEPGRTVSLRAPLGAPVCPVPSSPPTTVTVAYRDDDGREHSVTAEPTQSIGALALIEKDDCVAVLAAERADIRVESVSWVAGAQRSAELLISVTPTGRGSLEIVEARGTVLLGLDDDTGVAVQAVPLGLTADAASGPQTVTLRLLPNRCDQHAIAEDKRGTIMTLELAFDDGSEGVGYFRSPDAVKASLYAFVTDFCGTA